MNPNYFTLFEYGTETPFREIIGSVLGSIDASPVIAIDCLLNGLSVSPLCNAQLPIESRSELISLILIISDLEVPPINNRTSSAYSGYVTYEINEYTIKESDPEWILAVP